MDIKMQTDNKKLPKDGKRHSGKGESGRERKRGRGRETKKGTLRLNKNREFRNPY